MRRNGIPFIMMLFAIAAAPLALLPLVGASLVTDLSESAFQRDASDLRDGTPLRLISGPLIPVPGHAREFLVLAVDLPSLAAANRVCAASPRVNDTVQVFAETHLAPEGRAWRMPGNDLTLTKHLAGILPGVPLDGARLIRRADADAAHPRLPLHECRASSGRRIAKPNTPLY